jgi:hypothetical protein
MSLFKKILDKLGIKKDTSGSVSGQGAKPASTPAPAKSAPSAPTAGRGTPAARPAASGPARPTVAPTAKPATPAPMSEVDVVKKLEQLSAGKGLNWKVSIVDLLKLLDLDSSREARNELAQELGAPSEVMSDSARMNTWLHKEVLRKIAENGGNIPRELLD